MSATAPKPKKSILKSKKPLIITGITGTVVIVTSLVLFFQPLINEGVVPLIRSFFSDESVSGYINYPDSPTDNNKHHEDVGAIFVTEKEIITGSDDNLIKVWSRNGQLKFTLSYHSGDVQTLYAQGDLIVSGGNDKTIVIWNRKTNKIKKLQKHSGSIFKVLVHNGKIYSASADTTIKVWDLQSGDLLDTLTGHSNKVNGLAIIKKKLISISKDKTVRIWDIATHKMEKILLGHSRDIRGLAASENGIIVTSDTQRNMILWDLISQTKIDDTKTPAEIRMNELLIHNNTIIGASGASPTIYFYTNKKPITITKEMEAGNFEIESLFIYRKCLFGGTTEGTIAVWNIESRALLYEVKGTSTKALEVCR